MAITAASLNVKFGTEGVGKTKADIDSVGDAVNKADQKRKLLGAGFLGLGGIIGGAFIGATSASIGFGEQMANVNSIAQLSTEQINAVGDSVLDLATKTGQGPEVLAAGLYDIYSSGFQGAEGLEVLTAASYAANAGLTDTATSAKGITAVLNAYGLEASDATRVSDIMFQTVNDGVITFDELSRNMGNTLPMANALGVSFEELGAGYALMTKSGIGASQTETQLASLMRSAINPTTELTEAVQAYGYESVESLIATEGLTGYLDLLTHASGGTTEGLFELLGTAEATNAALTLGGENADEYAAMLDRMEKSSEGLGATQTALNKQMESTAFSLRLLKTNIQAAAIAIGVQFEPVIRVVAKAMTAMIKVFLNISKPVQQVIAGITALIGVVAAGAGAWILFGSTISLIGGILATIALPILAIVAAVAALYVAWDRNWGDIQGITQNAASAILGFLEPITDFLGGFMDAWNDTSEAVYQWGDTVDDIVPKMDLGERALRAFSAGLLAISGEDTPAWLVDLAFGFDRLADSLQAGGLSGFVSQLGTELRNLVSGIDIGSVVVTIGGWIINAASDLWDTVTSWIMGGYSGAGDGTGGAGGGRAAVSLGAVLVHIGSWAKGIVTDIWPYVRQWATDAMGAVASAAGTVWGVIVNIGSWAKGIVTDIWPCVREWASAAMSGVASAAGTVWGVLVNIGSWAKGVVSDIWPYVTQWATEAMSAIAGAAGTVWNVIVNIGSWAKGIITDIAPYIVQWAEAAIGGITSAAATIWNVLVNIGSWAKGIVSDIGPYIVSWAEAAVSGISTAAATIWNVLVNIGSWAKGIVSDIAPFLQGWAETAISAISGAVGTIWDAAIDIGSWAKGTWADLSAWVKSEVALAWTGNADDPVSLGAVSIKVGTFDIDVDFGGLYEKINARFIEETTVTPADLEGTRAAGESFGAKVRDLFEGGFGEALNGGGGGDGSASGNVGFARTVRAFVEGVISGLDIDWPDIKIPMPDITWPDMPDVWSIPFLADFIGMLLDLRNELGSTDWSIDIGMPTINWPDMPEPPGWMTSPPQWWTNIQAGRPPWDDGGGAAASSAVYGPEAPDWFRMAGPLPPVQPQGPPQDVPMPEFNLSGIQAIRDQMQGLTLDVGATQLAIAGVGSVSFTGPVAGIQALKAAMADTASGANILKTAMADAGSATFTGPLAGLQSLKAAMFEAQTASGTLKTAIDSIGGGGQAATGDVKGAGGGGPFASLLAGIVSAQAQLATFVQTTIALMAGWQTGMVTIVAGFGAAITTSLSAPLMASLAVFASFAQSTIALMAGWGTGIRTIVTSTMTATSAAISSGMASSRAAVQAGMAGIAASAAAGMAAFRNAVAAGMASSVAAVRSGVAQMVGVARAAAGSMAGAGQAIGRSLGQGIASGISSMIGSVAAAAANIVRAAVSAARSAGGISSPSTIMRDEVGKMLGLGAIIGVQSMIPDMMRTMADLVAIPSIAPDTANRSLAMNGGYGGSGSGGYGQGGGTTIVNHHYHYSATVTVQGDVTTERRLTSNIAREIWTTEAEELRRGKIAAGVMSS